MHRAIAPRLLAAAGQLAGVLITVIGLGGCDSSQDEGTADVPDARPSELREMSFDVDIDVVSAGKAPVTITTEPGSTIHCEVSPRVSPDEKAWSKIRDKGASQHKGTADAEGVFTVEMKVSHKNETRVVCYAENGDRVYAQHEFMIDKTRKLTDRFRVSRAKAGEGQVAISCGSELRLEGKKAKICDSNPKTASSIVVDLATLQATVAADSSTAKSMKIGDQEAEFEGGAAVLKLDLADAVWGKRLTPSERMDTYIGFDIEVVDEAGTWKGTITLDCTFLYARLLERVIEGEGLIRDDDDRPSGKKTLLLVSSTGAPQTAFGEPATFQDLDLVMIQAQPPKKPRQASACKYSDGSEAKRELYDQTLTLRDRRTGKVKKTQTLQPKVPECRTRKVVGEGASRTARVTLEQVHAATEAAI